MVRACLALLGLSLALVGLAGWPLPAWLLPLMGNPAFSHETIPAASGQRAGVTSGQLRVGCLMPEWDGGLASVPSEPSCLDPVPHSCPALPQLASGGCGLGTWLHPGPRHTQPSSRWAGAGWVWLLLVETGSLCRQGGRRREGLGAKVCRVFWLSSLGSRKLSLRCKICPGSRAPSASCMQGCGNAYPSLEQAAFPSVDSDFGGEIPACGCWSRIQSEVCCAPRQGDVANPVLNQRCLGAGCVGMHLPALLPEQVAAHCRMTLL